jgi:hypothetical protein
MSRLLTGCELRSVADQGCLSWIPNPDFLQGQKGVCYDVLRGHTLPKGGTLALPLGTVRVPNPLLPPH